MIGGKETMEPNFLGTGDLGLAPIGIGAWAIGWRWVAGQHGPAEMPPLIELTSPEPGKP